MTDTGLPRVLMVAYHFPPLAGSSGIQRTLRFVQHLPRFGWQPMVLTAAPRAYERTSEDLMGEVPADVVVERAFALDTARHLSLAGRYVGAMARPDRWVSWRPFAVRAGLGLVRRYRPRLLWSTYPIATAHLIGADLQRRTGLPWVADFRDPMAQPGYPEDPLTRARYEAIERAAIERAALCVFATPGAAREYRRRYPHAAERIVVIENGYDEDSFAGCEEMAAAGPLNPGCTTLLHSGIVYPSERDPTQLFEAVARLASQSPDMARTLRLRFRASAHDDLLHALADRFGIRPLIEILPPLPYREALSEMMRADGLLVLQASNCNDQVPAKVYEYLRTGRPVLGLTDPVGDTAQALRLSGIEAIAPLDKAEAIAGLLSGFLSGQAPPTVASQTAIAAASRVGRTGELAQWLSRVVVGEPAV
jgi:glycosyltransferase involved in cell wall biosynthesis